MSALTLPHAYTYCFIPAALSSPVSERTGDGSGGLANDALLKNCKDYFSATAQLPNTPEDRKALADAIRKSAMDNGATAEQLSKLSDDQLLTLNSSTTCEISALTIPCPANENKAVSLYSDDKARGKELPLNVRATALGRACGHGQIEIYGDAFVSR